MEQQKKSNKGKYILIGLGVVAVAGTAIYFATRKKSTSDIVSDEINDSFDVTTPSKPTSSGSGNRNSGFPLKKGSRGDLVQNVQEALIKKYGASILPKWGADGIWGSEMQTALIAKGLPTTIDADSFTKIVTSSGSTNSGSGSSSGTTNKPSKKGKFNPSLVATNLRVAIIDDNFSMALKWLSRIWTVKGYKMVSTYFKKKRIGGVRKTIVNALLTQFWKSSEKKKLNEHFYRIGLKYNGSQWSLSGLDEILCDRIKTIKPAMVWNASGKKIKVPQETILGHFIDAKNDITKFRTLDNKILFTTTKCICYV